MIKITHLKRVLGMTILLAAITLPIDQLAKRDATRELLVIDDPSDTTIYQGRRQDIFAAEATFGWVNITKTYVRNHGASWGFWSRLDSNWRLPAIVLMGLVATMVLLYGSIRLLSAGNRWAAFAMCGVVAGSLGNLIDRLRLGFVVDFLSLKVAVGSWTYSLPSFNIADIVIVFSLISLIATLYRVPEKA